MSITEITEAINPIEKTQKINEIIRTVNGIQVNNSTVTFKQGDEVKGTLTTNQSSNSVIELDAGGGQGASRNIGEIVTSTIPLVDAGLHLADGSLLSGSGSYSDFVSYMASLYNSNEKVTLYAWGSGTIYTDTATPGIGTNIYKIRNSFPYKIGTVELLASDASDGGVNVGKFVYTNNRILYLSSYTTSYFADSYSRTSTYDTQVKSAGFFMRDTREYNYDVVERYRMIHEMDGILSGFNTTIAYATASLTDGQLLSVQSIELVVKVKLNTLSTTASFIESTASHTGIILRCVNASTGQVNAWIGNGSSWFVSNYNTGITLTESQWLYIKLVGSSGSWQFYDSTDGTTWTARNKSTASGIISFPEGKITLGGTSWESYAFTDGEIDLNKCYCNCNGTRYWTGYTDYNAEQSWQRAVSKYGVCGKYVYDSTNNTVRLPKITGFIEGTDHQLTLGDLTEAGIPDHTHIYIVGSSAQASGTDHNCMRTNISRRLTSEPASGSNHIYGNSDTVQPQSMNVLYYIVVATATKTDIQVDIDDIATDLNGKADKDLANLSSSASKNFDGQWVSKQLSLATSVATTQTNYSLSSYLPNDGQIYEVIVGGVGYYNGNMFVTIGSDIMELTTPADGDYRTVLATQGSGRRGMFRCIIPVGAERYISSLAVGSTNAYIGVLGYRRVGTNV